MARTKVEEVKNDRCETCEGRGRSPIEAVYAECPVCKGTGLKA